MPAKNTNLQNQNNANVKARFHQGHVPYDKSSPNKHINDICNFLQLKHVSFFKQEMEDITDFWSEIIKRIQYISHNKKLNDKLSISVADFKYPTDVKYTGGAILSIVKEAIKHISRTEVQEVASDFVNNKYPNTIHDWSILPGLTDLETEVNKLKIIDLKNITGDISSDIENLKVWNNILGIFKTKYQQLVAEVQLLPEMERLIFSELLYNIDDFIIHLYCRSSEIMFHNDLDLTKDEQLTSLYGLMPTGKIGTHNITQTRDNILSSKHYIDFNIQRNQLSVPVLANNRATTGDFILSSLLIQYAYWDKIQAIASSINQASQFANPDNVNSDVNQNSLPAIDVNKDLNAVINKTASNSMFSSWFDSLSKKVLFITIILGSVSIMAMIVFYSTSKKASNQIVSKNKDAHQHKETV